MDVSSKSKYLMNRMLYGLYAEHVNKEYARKQSTDNYKTAKITMFGTRNEQRHRLLQLLVQRKIEV